MSNIKILKKKGMCIMATWNDVEGAVNSEATQIESVLLLSNSSNNLPHMPLKFYDEMIT